MPANKPEPKITTTLFDALRHGFIWAIIAGVCWGSLLLSTQWFPKIISNYPLSFFFYWTVRSIPAGLILLGFGYLLRFHKITVRSKSNSIRYTIFAAILLALCRLFEGLVSSIRHSGDLDVALIFSPVFIAIADPLLRWIYYKSYLYFDNKRQRETSNKSPSKLEKILNSINHYNTPPTHFDVFKVVFILFIVLLYMFQTRELPADQQGWEQWFLSLKAPILMAFLSGISFAIYCHLLPFLEPKINENKRSEESRRSPGILVYFQKLFTPKLLVLGKIFLLSGILSFVFGILLVHIDRGILNYWAALVHESDIFKTHWWQFAVGTIFFGTVVAYASNDKAAVQLQKNPSTKAYASSWTSSAIIIEPLIALSCIAIGMVNSKNIPAIKMKSGAWVFFIFELIILSIIFFCDIYNIYRKKVLNYRLENLLDSKSGFEIATLRTSAGLEIVMSDAFILNDDRNPKGISEKHYIGENDGPVSPKSDDKSIPAAFHYMQNAPFNESNYSRDFHRLDRITKEWTIFQWLFKIDLSSGFNPNSHVHRESVDRIIQASFSHAGIQDTWTSFNQNYQAFLARKRIITKFTETFTVYAAIEKLSKHVNSTRDFIIKNVDESPIEAIKAILARPQQIPKINNVLKLGTLFYPSVVLPDEMPSCFLGAFKNLQTKKLRICIINDDESTLDRISQFVRSSLWGVPKETEGKELGSLSEQNAPAVIKFLYKNREDEEKILSLLEDNHNDFWTMVILDYDLGTQSDGKRRTCKDLAEKIAIKDISNLAILLCTAVADYDQSYYIEKLFTQNEVKFSSISYCADKPAEFAWKIHKILDDLDLNILRGEYSRTVSKEVKVMDIDAQMGNVLEWLNRGFRISI